MDQLAAMLRHTCISISLAFMLLASALPGAVSAAAEAPDVHNLMTPEEFRAAGLDKLSADEIEALNRWVIRYTAKEAPAMRQANEVVRAEIKKVNAEVIKSRIDGEFRGWEGHTVFRLQNGQLWKQRMIGKFRYRATSPEVEMRRNLLGFWDMRVVEADRKVAVSRLE